MLTALTYSEFIQVLYLLEVHIPWLPSEPEKAFLIFRSGGSGYSGPQGCGPCASFMSRSNEEMVPEFEIKKTLGLLNLPETNFVATVDGRQVPKQSTAGNTEGSQSKSKSN